MKISLSWLQHWIKDIPKDIDHRLTMAGLEVESVSMAAPCFSGVVIGEVIDVVPHPDADKLKIATVNVGHDMPLQIVCGAPNVAKGIKVPTALVGAVLPGEFKIKLSQLRGVESSGMLCSARELGLSEDHSGLMILDAQFNVGDDFRAAFDLDDTLIEVDLTPNRGDCLSMLGVAREVAAITKQSFVVDTVSTQPIALNDVKVIHVENPEDCPRYLGRFIKNLNPDAITPLWMLERLRRADIRSHGILVDITNYILIELGQPLHAFDANKIQGDIIVRRAESGTSLTLLNDDTVSLNSDILTICDENTTLAIAGIMGGKLTACDDKTTNIFLESAWFNPITIAGKARQYGLQTDASHRYERGVDFMLAEQALERATELLITLAGGQAGPICRAESPECLPKRAEIAVNFSRVSQIIGMNFTSDAVVDMLSRIGTVSNVNADSLQLKAPSHRFDIAIEEDLIEEVARLNGYDNIPVKRAKTTMSMLRVPENITPLLRLKEVLIARDYMEVITMSFVKPQWQEIIDKTQAPIALKNPISQELSVMRTTLLPGLLATVDYNFKRQQKRLRIFESGLTFKGSLESVDQAAYLGGAICGDIRAPEWGSKARKVDFFDIKGDVEALLNISGLKNQFTFVVSDHKALHPGQSANIINMAGSVIGYLGALHPSIQKQLDIDVEIFVFEILISEMSISELPKFRDIPKFPSSKRDLALLVPKNVTSDQIIQRIKSCDNRLLSSVQLFDIYKNVAMDGEESSMAFTLFFQNLVENLIDSEIDAIIEKILKDLRLINVTLR